MYCFCYTEHKATMTDTTNREEKRVEYLELIYDLIFVYIVGRNNSLLHHMEDGFVSAPVFLGFVLCSLAVIQIWNYSTFYMNMYGRNSARDHVFLFVNMYLLYYIGTGTRVHWEGSQDRYYIAWALILINIGIHYLIERRGHLDEPEALRTIRGLTTALFGEAFIVLLAIPAPGRWGFVLSGAAILFGIFATWRLGGNRKASAVDFPHLSERAMLYVVFTFGEMIIALAGYFEEGFEASSFYFSTLSFLIVAGLFLSYEVLYNRIIDRELSTSGMGYMLIHIFLIFGMNSITASLEFMRDPAVRLWPKALFLVFSFLLFFGCLFALIYYAKAEMKGCRKALAPAAVISALFVVLMLLFRERMYINIAVSVIYVYIIFLLLRRFSRTPFRSPRSRS